MKPKGGIEGKKAGGDGMGPMKGGGTKPPNAPGAGCCDESVEGGETPAA